MKDIVNKKGFTLVELLIVIALISVLLIIAMPNLIGIFSNSVKSTMKIQEQEIKDSSLLYLEDFCKNKLSGKTCPNSINRNDDNTYSGQISLQTLIDEEYIEEIEIQKTKCDGCIVFTNNKSEVYLTCKDVYSTDNASRICNLN